MKVFRSLIAVVVVGLLVIGCAGASQDDEDEQAPLKVVATTSIIGDVAAQVGGEAIDLTTLMAPGQDPHSYEPSTTDLTRVAEADVILINGWDLEEGLVSDLANIAGAERLVVVSEGIAPLAADEDGEHEDEGEDEGEHGHGEEDPHVWMDPANVQQWARNMAAVFGEHDADNVALYAANAAAYEQELTQLEQEMEAALAVIAPEQRKLVTNHDALAYFARRFDFEVVGTVIPAASTLAEPSAQALVALVEVMRAEGVCTIFAETTANTRLAETVAGELEACAQVEVRRLYTGALGEEGSGAESYIGMMQNNVAEIVAGLGG